MKSSDVHQPTDYLSVKQQPENSERHLVVQQYTHQLRTCRAQENCLPNYPCSLQLYVATGSLLTEKQSRVTLVANGNATNVLEFVLQMMHVIIYLLLLAQELV